MPDCLTRSSLVSLPEALASLQLFLPCAQLSTPSTGVPGLSFLVNPLADYTADMSMSSESTISTPNKIEAVTSTVAVGHDEQPQSDKSKLKTRNGIILVPQPSDDPNDPLVSY